MSDLIRNERLNESYERLVHPSGLTILLFPKKSVTTYASLTVRYGAQDTVFTMDGKEYKTPDGTAHFLEHKMFACPDGSDANELFSALGADANAWTDYDKTAYLFSTTEPAQAALRTLIEFVSEPYFTPENVAKEKGIIREEIAMGEDDPWQRLHEQTLRATYARHAIRRKICGTRASIGRITHKTLQLCYDAFYHPSNMYLTVCGDMTMAQLLQAVDAPLTAWATRRPKAPDVTRTQFDEPMRPMRKRCHKTGRVSRPLFRISWKDAVYASKTTQRVLRESAMNVLSEMLFCRAGRFYDELFEGGKLSPTYFYGYSTLDSHSPIAYHSIEGETDDPDAVGQAYISYLADIRRTGLCREDFERIRRVLYASFVSQFDFPDDIAELMCEAQGAGRGVFDSLDALQSLTFEQVQALFDESFDLKATVFSTIVPDKKSKEEEQE
jgi:predicted Zn-dependent peptidase